MKKDAAAFLFTCVERKKQKEEKQKTAQTCVRFILLMPKGGTA